MKQVNNKNLLKGLRRKGKALNDIDTILLFGEKMKQAKENHSKTSRLPFAKEGYDNEVIDYAINIYEAYSSGEYSKQELAQYFKNSIQI